MSNKFSEALEIILHHEGGYVNHPKDPGGETNLGVTKRVYEDFGGTKYKFVDNNLQEVEVTLEARTAAVSKSAPVSSEMNLNEFTSIMSRIGVNLKPEQQKKIITALTKQSDRARRSLQRTIGKLS